MDFIEVIIGILWNFLFYDLIKMEIVDYVLYVLIDEVIIFYFGWEWEFNEDCKLCYIEWELVFINIVGCFRNVSLERSEVCWKFWECDGLVDVFIFIVQVEIGQKDLDSKFVENCVCFFWNLLY